MDQRTDVLNEAIEAIEAVRAEFAKVDPPTYLNDAFRAGLHRAVQELESLAAESAPAAPAPHKLAHAIHMALHDVAGTVCMTVLDVCTDQELAFKLEPRIFSVLAQACPPPKATPAPRKRQLDHYDSRGFHTDVDAAYGEVEAGETPCSCGGTVMTNRWEELQAWVEKQRRLSMEQNGRIGRAMETAYLSVSAKMYELCGEKKLDVALAALPPPGETPAPTLAELLELPRGFIAIPKAEYDEMRQQLGLPPIGTPGETTARFTREQVMDMADLIRRDVRDLNAHQLTGLAVSMLRAYAESLPTAARTEGGE